MWYPLKIMNRLKIRNASSGRADCSNDLLLPLTFFLPCRSCIYYHDWKMSLGYIFLRNAELPNLPAHQFTDLSIQNWDDLLSDWPKSISSWILLCWDLTMRQILSLAPERASFYVCWSRVMVTSSCPLPATARRDSRIILPPTSLEDLWDENAFP